MFRGVLTRGEHEASLQRLSTHRLDVEGGQHGLLVNVMLVIYDDVSLVRQYHAHGAVVDIHCPQV